MRHLIVLLEALLLLTVLPASADQKSAIAGTINERRTLIIKRDLSGQGVLQELKNRMIRKFEKFKKHVRLKISEIRRPLIREGKHRKSTSRDKRSLWTVVYVVKDQADLDSLRKLPAFNAAVEDAVEEMEDECPDCQVTSVKLVDSLFDDDSNGNMEVILDGVDPDTGVAVSTYGNSNHGDETIPNDADSHSPASNASVGTVGASYGAVNWTGLDTNGDGDGYIDSDDPGVDSFENGGGSIEGSDGSVYTCTGSCFINSTSAVGGGVLSVRLVGQMEVVNSAGETIMPREGYFFECNPQTGTCEEVSCSQTTFFCDQPDDACAEGETRLPDGTCVRGDDADSDSGGQRGGGGICLTCGPAGPAPGDTWTETDRFGHPRDCHVNRSGELKCFDFDDSDAQFGSMSNPMAALQYCNAVYSGETQMSQNAHCVRAVVRTMMAQHAAESARARSRMMREVEEPESEEPPTEEPEPRPLVARPSGGNASDGGLPEYVLCPSGQWVPATETVCMRREQPDGTHAVKCLKKAKPLPCSELKIKE